MTRGFRKKQSTHHADGLGAGVLHNYVKPRMGGYADANARNAAVHIAVQKVAEQYKYSGQVSRIIIGHFVEGKTANQLAGEVGTDPRKVKATIEEVRLKLQELLQPHRK